MKELINMYNKFFTVTHNGVKIEFFKNGIEVLDYISKSISAYEHLNPQLTIDLFVNANTLFVVYEYRTIYKEMFLVEIEEM